MKISRDNHSFIKIGDGYIANLLKLTNDYVFKKTFGYVGDEEITKVLLKDILNISINTIELDNATITEKELFDDKIGIMDIKVNIDSNTQVDVEMQVVNKDNIEKRLLFYWGKMYTSSIKQGEGYETGKKTIVIMIANFELKTLENIEKYITRWNIREEDYSSIILTDIFEICIIELPKFVKYAEKSKSENINLWMKFIQNPEVEIMVDDKNLKETKNAINIAKKKLEKMSKDKHERELADLREKYIRDQYSVEQYRI